MLASDIGVLTMAAMKAVPTAQIRAAHPGWDAGGDAVQEARAMAQAQAILASPQALAAFREIAEAADAAAEAGEAWDASQAISDALHGGFSVVFKSLDHIGVGGKKGWWWRLRYCERHAPSKAD